MEAPIHLHHGMAQTEWYLLVNKDNYTLVLFMINYHKLFSYRIWSDLHNFWLKVWFGKHDDLQSVWFQVGSDVNTILWSLCMFCACVPLNFLWAHTHILCGIRLMCEFLIGNPVKCGLTTLPIWSPTDLAIVVHALCHTRSNVLHYEAWHCIPSCFTLKQGFSIE